MKTLKTLAKFFLSFGIIAYMIWAGRLDLDAVKKGLMNPLVVSSSLILIFTGTMIGIGRWRLLLIGQGIKLSTWQIIRYAFIGLFFNTTMPGVVSGDVVKAWYVLADSPKGQKKTPVLTAIIIDRMMGLFGLITVSMISMLFYWHAVWGSAKLHSIAIMNLILAAGVLFFFLYVTLSNWGPFIWLRDLLLKFKENKIGSAFLKAYDACSAYRENPKILWGSLLISASTHCCIVLAILFCARALGETHMQVYQIFLLAPIGLLSIALPIAPAGLGVGHVAFNALFLSVGSRMGAEIFTLFIALQIIINLFGVIFYIKAPKPTPEAALG